MKSIPLPSFMFVAHRMRLRQRLENDILITDVGHLELMSDIPIEPDEIEAFMQ